MIRRVKAAVAVLLCAVLLASCGDASVFSDSENLTKKVKRSTDTALTYHYADGAQDPPTTYTTFANGVTSFALSAFRARLVRGLLDGLIHLPARLVLLHKAVNKVSALILEIGGR